VEWNATQLSMSGSTEFVGWVEWNATQLSMSGSTAFHPTYKKLAKVLITVEWLKNRFCQ
jgi:hypothetical protein